MMSKLVFIDVQTCKTTILKNIENPTRFSLFLHMLELKFRAKIFNFWILEVSGAILEDLGANLTQHRGILSSHGAILSQHGNKKAQKGSKEGLGGIEPRPAKSGPRTRLEGGFGKGSLTL